MQLTMTQPQKISCMINTVIQAVFMIHVQIFQHLVAFMLMDLVTFKATLELKHVLHMVGHLALETLFQVVQIQLQLTTTMQLR